MIGEVIEGFLFPGQPLTNVYTPALATARPRVSAINEVNESVTREAHQLSSKLWEDRDGRRLAQSLSLSLPALRADQCFTALCLEEPEYSHRILPHQQAWQPLPDGWHWPVRWKPAFCFCLQNRVIHAEM